MANCKPVKTPMETGLKLDKIEGESGKYDYRNLIGCLMYVAVCTRPDIAHAVSMLSHFNNNHGEVHWKAAKRVLRYLKGTLNYCVIFKKSGLKDTSFVDADWAGDAVDRRSYTGTKHIDVRHHFVRQDVNEGRLSIRYCPTDDMIADVLTKASVYLLASLLVVLVIKNVPNMV